jgi:adenylate cyclase
MLWREVREFGGVPWLIGVHIDVDQEGTEALLDRLAGAAAIGLIVILAATVALQMVARRVREPMQALAALSNRVRALDFGVETVGKPSIVREINEANVAFGRMLAGLRWFETYVPKNLVLNLMRRAESAEIASEERMVTVMFTDIAGFTTISEARTAADLATLLNTHFTLINHCVEAEDGTVDKYIGDSVMAFWGAPTEQPDHAARACRAVAAVAADLAVYNEKRRARGRQPIRLRIGLHSGWAVAGNIGSPGRINYTLVGDTVNVANRLEQLGKQVDDQAECVILASAETRELAGDAVTFDFVGEHKLRGRSEDTPVYRVIIGRG